ncbi:hypothetical protein DPM19_28120 [Actinomadura craniellae]|uniref:Pyrrolo-quinoline quinone repeat domain-containing protein n=1 Tax=Actinomadura craniellae TaxID=2231787 RepID=A0A365GYD0_9ACTN|nr:PQQ-binding-like beta-propeller repeat protein [Actinomadura craniellae]RAY11845.1 hypothetical protein DPM19_28120 [Actinomadura craniellae]
MDVRRIRSVSLAVGVVAAVLTGIALTLLIRSFVAVGVEAEGSCGGGANSCPRGTGWMLGLSIPLLCIASPLLFIGLAKSGLGGPFATLAAVLSLAVGVVPGWAVYGWAHGETLKRVWAAPPERPNSVAGEGSWLHGGTIIRGRFDGLVGYDVATGRQRWSYDVPQTDVLCGMSQTTAGGVGLVAHAVEHRPCTGIVAVDLETGRPLWQKRLGEVPGLSQNMEPGTLAVAGGTAVVQAYELLTGYDLRTGAQRWESRAPEGCRFGGTAAGGDQALTELNCLPGQPKARALDLATGRVRWEVPVPFRGASANIKLLSAAPPVLHVTGGGQRGANALISFGAGGRVTATIPVDGGDQRLDINEYGFDATPLRRLVVHGDLIIAVTTEVGGAEKEVIAYGLADGRMRWRTEVRDTMAITMAGDRLLALEGGGLNAPKLHSLALRDGRPTHLGAILVDVFADEVGLYAQGPHVILVKERATSDDEHPIAVFRTAAD